MAGKFELENVDFNLRESITPTIKTLAFRAWQRKLELTCEIRPEVPELLAGDPSRLRQIIINLIGNAIKFTERGEVGLSVAIDSQTEDAVDLHFVVHDTGVGVPPEKQKVIFEPFSQADGSTARKFGGTGLGLTISSWLVEMMGGRIWVESTERQGSAFHFTAILRPGANVVKNPVVASSQLAGLSVLMVDDNATNRRILEAMVTGWGMRPTLAESGPAALQCLKEAEPPFSLILTDINMPGMDGFALVAQVRQSRALAGGAAIILFTSAGQRGDSARAKELGVTQCLTKLVSRTELFEAIVRALATPDEQVIATTSVLVMPEGKRLRILLADDNAVNQKLAARLLEKKGHRVTVTGNGIEALAALDREEFDIVFMDVQMPEMDGFEATAAIRKRERGTGLRQPVIAMTAHAMQGDRERCLEAGMDDYISKPVNNRQLIELLEKFSATSQEEKIRV